MTCAACGAANEAEARFCEECGAPLGSTCPTCGAPTRPGARFCKGCGSSLAGGPPAAAAAVPASPVPAPVAERRLVTILFADLVGFTTFAEGRDSEEVRELLTRYFELSSEIIARYGGTVEKFIGDAVMAVFGAPTTRENDAERAVRAALELVSTVGVLGTGIRARAGVLTGEAAVTLGATNQGMVAGDLVNTASRLQSAAAPGTVLVGEATQRAAATSIVFEPAGEQALKGKAAPVAAWQALRVVAEVGGRGRSEGLEAPFVGRDDEMRLLKDLFHATSRERRARLVSVVGPAGIGKSRLAWEFLKYIDGVVEEVWWHQGRSPAYGEGVSFWALGEMVRARCGLLESDDERTTRARVAATALEHIPDEAERRWVEPALLALLGVGQAPSGGEALFAAWRTFFERMAQSGVVVMLFEDLHWADAGTLDFVDHVLEWSKSLPFYVVTLARPELLDRRTDWGAGKRSFTSLFLEPLSEPSMRALLGGLVPGLPEGAVRSIVARADGMPLYAVETVRMLLADGKLRQEDGRYVPEGDLSSLAVPGSLTALISARLDALDPADRSLVQDASVLGQSFTPASLGAVAGIDPTDLEPRLRGLVRRELMTLEADPRSPERGQYAFVQALIREVAYNTLAKRDRRAKHLAAARWFESIGSDELAGVLARHYFAAWQASPEGPEADALAAQARVALLAATDRAVALGAHDQAIAFLRQALIVTRGADSEADLLVRIGRSASSAADHEQAEAALRQALAIRTEDGDVLAIIGATAELARVLLNAYRTDQALELLEAAPTVPPEHAADPAVVALKAQLARGLMFAGDSRRSIVVSDEVLEAAEGANLVAIIADALITRGTSLANVGRLYEGSGVIEAGRQLAEAHGLTSTVLRALNNQGGLLAAIDPRRSFQVDQSLLELARRTGSAAHLLNGMSNAVTSALRVGEWDWALREAGALLAEEMDPADRASVLTAWVSVAACRGLDLGAALVDIEVGLEGSNDPQSIAERESALGWLALAEGRLADARDAWHRTAALMAGPAHASVHALIGRSCLWAGDADGVREAHDGLMRSSAHGPALEAERTLLCAHLATLDGRRTQAVADYRRARSAMRDLGLPFDTALAGIDMFVALGPDDPDAREAATESWRILDGLGAVPYLRRLDELIASAAPVADDAVAHPA